MKDSVSIALEKVIKVYKSCTTTSQYVIANKYRQLFRSMYVNEIFNGDLTYEKEIGDLIFDAERDVLNKLKTPKTT